MLVDHLNDWVSFAVSSLTKFLAFDLTPARFGTLDNRYLFPFELIHSFPNQKRLDLHAVYTSGKDLEVVLSNCCGFEWLSILRCQLHDELKVDHPLPSLLYLSVEDSRATPFVENLRVHTERVLVCQERVYH
uniref:At1g61320/AtMIF1 LRR domain-containing protein n=1 Tax=Oryza meridionalis TaxID=40149 RepID=A0A0E0DDR5_9ORYZ